MADRQAARAAFPEMSARPVVGATSAGAPLTAAPAPARPAPARATPTSSDALGQTAVTPRGLGGTVARVATLVAVLAYVASSLPGALGLAAQGGSTPQWLLGGILVAASARCLARATLIPAQRVPWLVLGLGLASWGAGEFLLAAAPSLLASRGGFSLSDLASLAFYPAAYVGVLLLLRVTVPSFSALLWLDGLSGALAVSAVVAVVAFRPVLAHSGGDLVGSATSLAYPLADLMLIAVVVFSMAVTGWRPGSALGMVVGALLLIVVADGYSLWWTSTGHSSSSTALDSLWPLGVLLMAEAAGRRPVPGRAEPPRPGLRSLVFPIAFSLTALVLLLSGLFRSLNTAGYELATSALAFLVVRMVLTAVSNLEMTAASRREALTDALTGLGNRRKLMGDLEAAIAATDAASPTMLMLLDLDGFKLYNDTFGHPAGDALLARLGRALREAVLPWGEVYRLGGDEFCALCHRAPEDFVKIVPSTLRALTERGEGFSVTASFGSVTIPSEAADVTLALQLADQRLYQRKGERRRTNDSKQARDVLMQALRERHAGLPEHLGGVATLARSLARRFGLSSEEIDQVTRGAELHDIGKMAMPETILDKPAPLDASELALIRQHTVIGERILDAAPALRPVGMLVRASHEHFDGTGYPDRLAGQDIPLGARIIAVCDAYEAMTSGRPYRAPISIEEAVAELRRCAGSQFDPGVVEAFCEEALGIHGGAPPVPALPEVRLSPGDDPSAPSGQ